MWDLCTPAVTRLEYKSARKGSPTFQKMAVLSTNKPKPPEDWLSVNKLPRAEEINLLVLKADLEGKAEHLWQVPKSAAFPTTWLLCISQDSGPEDEEINYSTGKRNQLWLSWGTGIRYLSCSSCMCELELFDVPFFLSLHAYWKWWMGNYRKHGVIRARQARTQNTQAWRFI